MADKKKRGESGVSNAKNIAFRYGGSPCNFDLSHRRSDHPRGAGSLLVRAMNLAVKLPGFEPSAILVKRTDAAMANCTHPDLI